MAQQLTFRDFPSSAPSKILTIPSFWNVPVCLRPPPSFWSVSISECISVHPPSGRNLLFEVWLERHFLAPSVRASTSLTNLELEPEDDGGEWE